MVNPKLKAPKKYRPMICSSTRWSRFGSFQNLFLQNHCNSKGTLISFEDRLCNITAICKFGDKLLNLRDENCSFKSHDARMIDTWYVNGFLANGNPVSQKKPSDPYFGLSPPPCVSTRSYLTRRVNILLSLPSATVSRQNRALSTESFLIFFCIWVLVNFESRFSHIDKRIPIQTG